MKRRDFIRGGLLAGSSLGAAGAVFAGKGRESERPLLIDAHCHAGRGLNYGQSDPNLDPWTTYNDPAWTLRRMEEAGIDRSVIFPINNRTYERANQEIASYVRRWPHEFIGFAKHDGQTEEGKIPQMLRREVQQDGLQGLKLHGVPTREMVEAAEELRIPILFHPPSVNESLAVIRASPGVSFILAHLGSFASRDWKEHVRAIDAAKRLPNLYLDTSSVVFGQYLERAARELPAEKLIFGSDGPLVDSRVELHKIRLLKLPREKEELVLGRNLLRLLGSRPTG